jgi:hypothetical protein
VNETEEDVELTVPPFSVTDQLVPFGIPPSMNVTAYALTVVTVNGTNGVGTSVAKSSPCTL